MNRTDFIKKGIQAGLFALLAFVVIALRSRIVATGNCSSCPDTGSCPGKKECMKY
ncbi:MAG: hypothetical protein IPN67_18535 [Bacteroidales bacterium]|nr:hypothetical protein [Bacteroidales bacterium]MBK8884280.1 hypothetical protein [Bacteroidales bacterium]